jgi:hypothetical protein
MNRTLVSTLLAEVAAAPRADEPTREDLLEKVNAAADGTAGSPDFSYLFICAVNRHDGTFEALAAWLAYHVPGTRFTVQARQREDGGLRSERDVGGEVIDCGRADGGRASDRNMDG